MVFAGIGTHVMDTEITTNDGTVVESDGVGIAGGGRHTTDSAARGSRGMRVVSGDFTTVELDIGASVSTHNYTTGGRSVIITLDSQVLKNIILHIHQGHRTERVGTGIRFVVHDNHRIDIIALEGDRVHRRLSYIVLIEVKVRVRPRT